MREIMKNGFIIFLILAAGPAIANPCKSECWQQGEFLTGQFNGAYNAPAIWAVRGKEGAFFADASFLYWMGGEEGLAIASNGVFNSGTVFFATETKTYYQNFEYKPGFKLGVGFVCDHSWSTYAEYTWLRGTHANQFYPPSNDIAAGTSAALSGTPVLLVGDWFLNGTSFGQALSATNISSKWHYALDLVDFCASRPFYQGPRLTVNPYGGLRLAFIRQKMVVELTQPSAAFGSSLPAGAPAEPIGSRNYSNSWGLGPRFGADAAWLLSWGFRLESDFAASLLYTNYSKVSHSEDPASTAFNPGSYRASLNGYHCLRPMTELGLGFAWGAYLCSSAIHLDFSASYDFTYMWNQNMIRKLLDDTLTGASASSADLYIHGATLAGRLDF